MYQDQDQIEGQKYFTVSFLRLARNHLLGAALLSIPALFGLLLGRLEGSTHPEEAIIDQQRPNCVTSEQCQATHVFGVFGSSDGKT